MANNVIIIIPDNIIFFIRIFLYSNLFIFEKSFNKNNAYKHYEYIQMLSKCVKLNSEHTANVLTVYISALS